MDFFFFLFLLNRIIVLARITGTQLAAAAQLWVIMFWIIRWRAESDQTEEAILGDFSCVRANKHGIVTHSLQRCQAKWDSVLFFLCLCRRSSKKKNKTMDTMEIQQLLQSTKAVCFRLKSPLFPPICQAVCLIECKIFLVTVRAESICASAAGASSRN